MTRTGENVFKRKNAQSKGRYTASDDENVDVQSYDGKTFREAAEDWLEGRRDEIASTTYSRYVEALKRDIYPEYGDTPVQDINESEIVHFIFSISEKAEKQGKKVRQSTVQIISTIMNGVIQSAEESSGLEQADVTFEKNPYEALSPSEIERVCACARYNHTPEMLAVMLTLFCGIRTGEVCALNWNDVSLERREIFIHRSAHRVKNADPDNGKRTQIIVEEIPTKKHIRKVEIPAELAEYIGEFYDPGKNALTGFADTPMDARTLANRMERVFGVYSVKGINFQRLRKTYVDGKADVDILADVFQGKKPSAPYAGVLDTVWLCDEMTNDLVSLRMLIGLSAEEMSRILGISHDQYREIENRKCAVSWNQYLALLFFFHYNSRTQSIVEILGLYPESLKEKLDIAGE